MSSVVAPNAQGTSDDTKLLLPWLQIFREAQAAASTIVEDSLRGLPDTRQTRFIEMGRHEMEVWYQSPYPDDFSGLPKIYICEFCLKYHKSVTQLRRHEAKCVWYHPPGVSVIKHIFIFVTGGRTDKLVFRHDKFLQTGANVVKLFTSVC
jgi:hypothetical protein